MEYLNPAQRMQNSTVNLETVGNLVKIKQKFTIYDLANPLLGTNPKQLKTLI